MARTVATQDTQIIFIKHKKAAVIKGMLKIMHYKNEH